MADWISAQNALLRSDTPDWESCARLIEASKAITREISPLDMQAPLDAFPFALTTAHPSTTGPAWVRFLAADKNLKLLLAEAWIVAARRCSEHDVAPEVTMRRWAEALDEAMADLTCTTRYDGFLIEWLRAGLAANLPMRPPDLPIPPSPPIATTPCDIVRQMGRVTLSRYVGSGSGTPILIVHGLIGRQSVCDLEPDRSLVSALLARGCDVWVIDWGSPGKPDADQGFTEHVEGWLKDACDLVQNTTNNRPALMGVCQGGIFVLCYAAQRPDAVSGIALTGTPVDFHADLAGQQGYLNRLTRTLPRDVIDGLLAPSGSLPGATTGALFQAMTPGRTFAKYSIDLAAKLTKPEEMATFARMEAWLADRPDLPGGVAREWLINLYQENALIKDRFEIDGNPVRLANIEVPILNIIAEKDHIVPPACSRALKDYVPNAPYQSIDVPSGHIGVFVSEAARERVAPTIADWLAKI